MKCQRCQREATFHITELTGGEPVELHLCPQHAQEYLNPASSALTAPGNLATALAQHMAQQMGLGQTAQELEQLDQQTCPVCGITFHEFRSRGRLGCPYDYMAFENQLDPLILNIHGEGTHVGKVPRRSARASEKRTQLIRLRREMTDAVAEEDYERASRLRDEIRRIEESEV